MTIKNPILTKKNVTVVIKLNKQNDENCIRKQKLMDLSFDIVRDNPEVVSHKDNYDGQKIMIKEARGRARLKINKEKLC